MLTVNLPIVLSDSSLDDAYQHMTASGTQAVLIHSNAEYHLLDQTAIAHGFVLGLESLEALAGPSTVLPFEVPRTDAASFMQERGVHLMLTGLSGGFGRIVTTGDEWLYPLTLAPTLRRCKRNHLSVPSSGNVCWCGASFKS